MALELTKSFEVRKLPTLLTAIYLVLAWLLNSVVLAWVHDQYPRGSAPLPDALLRLLPELPAVMVVAEYVMLTLTVSAFGVMLLHQHRWIVVRRAFFCAALCYTMRALCIALLQVPVPSERTYCAPQSADGGLHIIWARVQAMFWAAGIEQLRPRVLCGDLIVSGHTITIFTSMLVFRQYAPRRFAVLGHVYHGLAFVAVFCILLARKHYSIDVLLAYALATRTFWTYHALAHAVHDASLERNPLAQVGWARLVRLLERDAPPPHLFLNALVWPSSCPQRIRRHFAV